MKLDKLMLWAAMSVGCALLSVPATAYAYKSKTHVVLANQVLADAKDGKLSIQGLGALSPDNAEVLAAINQFPAAFRAGVLGPDNYPDLIGGQVWVHANGSSPASSKTFEQRTLSQFRSIDYGMYLLQQAKLYRGTEAERREALAFAYGYLAHMVADGFAHSFVNEWAGGAWTYEKGRGMFGPLTEEVKHLAVEGLIDDMMVPVTNAQLELRAPLKFLDLVYRSPMNLPAKGERAGAFAGDHVAALLALRDTLREKARKISEGDFDGAFGKFAKVAAKASEAADLAQLPDPISDVTWFLSIRADLIDEVVNNLPRLSDCIAQNIVLGQNRTTTAPLATDACDAIDFEPPGSEARFVFNGNLNAVAHSGGSDPGSFSSNVQRLADYYMLVLGEGLRFDPLRDLESIGEIRSKINVCQPVIDWDGCENACEEASKVCVKAIKDGICLGCPQDGGEYDCREDWKTKAACTAAPHCWACDGFPLWEEITEGACNHGVNQAVPACNLCREDNDLCIADKSIVLLNELVSGPINEVVDELLQPLQDTALDAVMFVVFGRYLDEVQDALTIYDMRKKRGSPLWLVNAAFFQEDLRTGGREYLIRLFNQTVKVPLAAMSTAQSAAQFASTTWQYMTNLSPMGEEIVWGDPNTRQDDFAVYQNFIVFLYGLADGSSEAVLKDEANYWVNRVNVQREGRRSVKTNFIRLLDTMGMLHLLAGPTATALAQDIAQQSFDPKDLLNVRVDLNGFAPVHNTLQLTKLSLFSERALKGLFGSTFLDGRSAICRDNAHILCDGIGSLDDPNHHGPESTPLTLDPPAAQRFPLATTFDRERSVSLWAPRSISWLPGDIRSRDACVAAQTAFALAQTPTLIRDKYERIFMPPNGCITSSLSAALAGMRH